MPIFRVMTFNVLYGATNRERLVREVVQEIRPDVAVFTEARGTKEFESVAKDVGNHLVRGGGPMDRDFVVVASRWPIDESQRFRPGWGWSKWIRARIRPFGGPPLTVVGVQLPAHLLWPFEVLRVLEVGDLMGRVRDGTHIRRRLQRRQSRGYPPTRGCGLVGSRSVAPTERVRPAVVAATDESRRVRRLLSRLSSDCRRFYRAGVESASANGLCVRVKRFGASSSFIRTARTPNLGERKVSTAVGCGTTRSIARWFARR